MKMKRLFLLAAIGITFSSCDAIKDLAAVDVDTNFNVDIPLESNALSVSMKSVQLTDGSYIIDGRGEVDLENNDDLKEYIDGIRDMSTDNPLFEVSGVSGENVLYDLKITAQIENSETEFTLLEPTTVDASNLNGSVKYVNDLMTSWADEGWGNIVKFEVSGTSNFDLNTSPVKVKLKIPATVRYTPL